MRTARLMLSIALLAGQAAAAAEYAGYLTVNDSDYGYWEGRLMVVVAGVRQPLDGVTEPIDDSVDLELSEDLVQGLVRQFSLQPVTTAGVRAATAGEASDMAGGAPRQDTVVGDGGWARIGSYQTFGFGQYAGSDVTASVYCDRNPSVWVWVAGGSLDGVSGDAAVSRVMTADNGMARLRLACERPMEVSE